LVSDVLSDAVAELDDYVEGDFYGAEARERILKVRNEMHDLRVWLDTPPDMAREEQDAAARCTE
jgi:hypothetical protein